MVQMIILTSMQIWVDAEIKTLRICTKIQIE
jgi:hypothetical protein